MNRVAEHSGEYAAALEHVSADPEVMGGMPVFKGTRLPIENVIASLDSGVEFNSLHELYSFLTPELVQAARLYLQVTPGTARPRPLSEQNPDWEIKSSEVVHLGPT